MFRWETTPPSGYIHPAVLLPVEVLESFKAIEKHGLSAPVSMRQIRGNLWELRISRTRIFYVIIESYTMILLDAYKKQGQKAPDWEIETALRRMAEFI